MLQWIRTSRGRNLLEREASDRLAREFLVPEALLVGEHLIVGVWGYRRILKYTS